jgi:hypothetical protein
MNAEHFKQRPAVLLSLGMMLSSQASAQFPEPVRPECLGYQTIDVPGNIEYATLPPNMSSTNGGGYGFDTGAGVWKTYQLVDSEGATQMKAPDRFILPA